MANRILELLKQLVAEESITGTAKEQGVEQLLLKLLQNMPYFQQHPKRAGLSSVPGDCFGRSVVYGLVKGNSSKTVILINHHDVVDISCYGEDRAIACDMDKITEKLKGAAMQALQKMSPGQPAADPLQKGDKTARGELDPDAAADFASGEWLGGRGSNDMKGGMAAQLEFLEEYSQAPDRGSLLFFSVPDEESFSCGMRHGISLLQQLKEAFGLKYVLCLNSEPNRREKSADGSAVVAADDAITGAAAGSAVVAAADAGVDSSADGLNAADDATQDLQVVPVGSVGKLLPFVVLQGKSTHVSEYAHGLSPMGPLAGLVAATEGDLEFREFCGEQSTIAPVWMQVRDGKKAYDFSLPARAVGYCSVQTFNRSPQQVMEYFRTKLEQALAQQAARYPEAPTMTLLTSQELLDLAQQQPGFEEWNRAALEEVRRGIYEEGHSYPDETLTYVQRVLDFMNYTQPVGIIGFAPPYYPATNSLLMDKPYFQKLQQVLQRTMKVKYEEYFLGVSDCSYCGLTTSDRPEDYKNNTPLWGALYSFDMEALAQLQVPFMLLGPWGKNLHEVTERVNLKSLTEELPKALRAVTEAAWE